MPGLGVQPWNYEIGVLEGEEVSKMRKMRRILKFQLPYVIVKILGFKCVARNLEVLPI
jgi:hypothetical protein